MGVLIKIFQSGLWTLVNSITDSTDVQSDKAGKKKLHRYTQNIFFYIVIQKLIQIYLVFRLGMNHYAKFSQPLSDTFYGE